MLFRSSVFFFTAAHLRSNFKNPATISMVFTKHQPTNSNGAKAIVKIIMVNSSLSLLSDTISIVTIIKEDA